MLIDRNKSVATHTVLKKYNWVYMRYKCIFRRFRFSLLNKVYNKSHSPNLCIRKYIMTIKDQRYSLQCETESIAWFHNVLSNKVSKVRIYYNGYVSILILNYTVPQLTRQKQQVWLVCGKQCVATMHKNLCKVIKTFN